MNMESQIQYINVELIIPNRFQPRLTFDEKALAELSQSIKEHGIIQPIVVRRLGEKYEIIAGERRYKAAIMAGLTEVPVIVSNIDDSKSIEVAVLENIQRKNLSSIEEAKSYKKILDKGYLTQDKLAQRLGISQSTIANKLRLLNLSDKVQDALMNEKISERHARSILQINEHDLQDAVLNKIITERMTVKQLDDYIKTLNAPQTDANEINPNTSNTNIFDSGLDIDDSDIQSIFNSPYDESLSLQQEIDKIEPTEVLDISLDKEDSSVIPSIDVTEAIESNTNNNVDVLEDGTETTDSKEEKKEPFENLFKIFNQETYPSLDDEVTNMNTDMDNIFNIPNNDIDTYEEVKKEPQVITEIKEEFPIIEGDLSSVKLAISGLIDKIKKAGFSVINEDYDFEDIYQLIVKVNK